jgi:hypothetical protein
MLSGTIDSHNPFRHVTSFGQGGNRCRCFQASTWPRISSITRPHSTISADTYSMVASRLARIERSMRPALIKPAMLLISFSPRSPPPLPSLSARNLEYLSRRSPAEWPRAADSPRSLRPSIEIVQPKPHRPDARLEHHGKRRYRRRPSLQSATAGRKRQVPIA